MNNKFSAKFLIVSAFLLCSTIINAQPITNNNYVPPNQSERNLGALKLIQNIRYGKIPELSTDSTSDRILDLYLPKADGNKTLPIVVFVHGGGFTGGDKNVSDLCSNLAMQGFAVASINYTLVLKYKKEKGASCSSNMAKGLPKNGSFHPLLNEAVKTASDDAVLALGWLKSNAKFYNLDIKKVAISGGSAGAMTALYTTYSSGQTVLPIKAVVDLWGGLENANDIKKGAPPMLIYHGDLDALISIDYAHALKNRMEEVGSVNSKLCVLEGKGHAQYRYIVQNKIVEIAEFLKANL